MAVILWMILPFCTLLPPGEEEAQSASAQKDLAAILISASREGQEALDRIVRDGKPEVSRTLSTILGFYTDARLGNDRDESAAFLQAARAVAESYERQFASAALRERCALVESWGDEELQQRQHAVDLWTKGVNAFNTGQRNDAGELFARSISIAEELGDRLLVAQILQHLNTVEFWRGRYAEGLDLIRRARDLFEAEEDGHGVCDALTMAAYMHHLLGEYDQAATALEQAGIVASTISDPGFRAKVLCTSGELLYRQGKFKKALEIYRKALKIYESIHDEHNISLCLNNIGAFCVHIGFYQEAAWALHRSAGIYKEQGKLIFHAQSLVNLGDVYINLGDHERGLDCLLQAKEIYENSGRPIDEGMVTILLNIAVCRTKKGDREQALSDYKELLRLWRELKDSSGAAKTLKNMGSLLHAMGRRSEGRKVLEEALDLYEEQGDDHGICIVLHELGVLCAEGGQLEKAAQHLDRAVSLSRANGAIHWEAEILIQKALIDYVNKNFAACIRNSEEAFGLLEIAGERITAPALKIGFQSMVKDAAEPYLHALLRHHEKDPEEGYPRRAFSCVESWRSRALLDALEKDRNLLLLDADKKDLARVEELMQRLGRAVGAKRNLALNSFQRAEADETISRLENEIETVREKIALSSPAFAALEPGRCFSVEEIQKRGLDSNTLLLEYKLAEERSYLFAVTDEEFGMIVLPARETIEKEARYALELLSNPSPPLRRDLLLDEFVSVLNGLYETLVAPVFDDPDFDRPTLVVVPDGILSFVPFETLIRTNTKAGAAAFSDLDYLVLEKRIIYAPSAAVCVRLSERDAAIDESRTAGRGAPSLLVLANPAAGPVSLRSRPVAEWAPGEGALTGTPREIPAALTEAKAIAAFFENPRLRVNDEATEEELKSRGALDGHQIVHIAAHGIVDSDEPRLSGLALAPDENGREDGILMMIEVLGLRVTADMVVLSGCCTALGETGSGEGVVGLPWAFLIAGARSTVVSLWAVHDTSTARLMEAFYRYLTVDRLDRAEALRRAKIELIRDGDAFPRHWAPFVLIGDGGKL